MLHSLTTASGRAGVALVLQNAKRIRRFVRLWVLSLFHIFPHYLIKGTIFRKKKFTVHNMCFGFLSIPPVCTHAPKVVNEISSPLTLTLRNRASYI